MTDLFTRPLLTLEGVKPPRFSLAEILFGYAYKATRRREMFRGLGAFDEDDRLDPEEIVSHQHTIKVLNCTWTDSRSHYNEDKFVIVSYMLRDIIGNHQRAPSSYTGDLRDAAEWLIANADDVQNDLRYWATEWEFRRIAAKKAKIAALQAEVLDAERKNSVNVLEVIERRKFDHDERLRLWVEFGGERE